MICSVKETVSYLTLQYSRKLTRSIFGFELDEILRKLELSTCHYNMHSFRIGAATSPKQAGISDVHIKKLGLWKSDVYQ